MSGAARVPARLSGTGAAAWSWTVVAAVIVAAAVLIAGNAANRPALAAAVAVVQAAILAGWLVSFAGTLDAAVLAVIAVGVADAVLLRTRAATGGSIAGVIGLSVIGVLFHQLVRRDPRGVTAAVAVTLSAILLGAAMGLLLPLRELPSGRSAAFAGILAGAAALVAVRVPLGPDPIRRAAALAAGIVVSLLVGLGKGGLTSGHAVAMGASCTVTALLVDRLLARAATGGRPSAWPSAVVTAVAPLALVCPVAYLVGRVIAPGVG